MTQHHCLSLLIVLKSQKQYKYRFTSLWNKFMETSVNIQGVVMPDQY